MNEIEKNNFSLQNIKEKGSSILQSAGNFLDNAIGIFKKDEALMSTEEKVEKQHMLNFIYGMGAGIVIYHFLLGAVLLLGIIWFYNLSLKKTKVLMEEKKPKKSITKKPITKKRTYKKRKSDTTTKEETQKS